jgi:5'(3')-deoxyribonucleotidase
MNIAVDLDEVVADLLSNLILFHNNVYGTNLKRSDFFSYHYEEVWGGSKDEAVQKVREFIKSEYFLNILPVPGACEALLYLKQLGYKLFIVTGREDYTKEITQAWIQKHFSGIFSGIYHTNAYVKGSRRIKKSLVCSQLEALIIIDDDMMHIRDCLESGIKVIVFDNPWNQGDFSSEINRVSKWAEVIEVISVLSTLD